MASITMEQVLEKLEELRNAITNGFAAQLEEMRSRIQAFANETDGKLAGHESAIAEHRARLEVQVGGFSQVWTSTRSELETASKVVSVLERDVNLLKAGEGIRGGGEGN